ncbi:hypothetical protein B0H17DRAFT_1179275 [Mycena rosella]|uniref:Uncharacterized protein n=1 Tax=Mycena rosella TaxID=1033263 RepID=A0AAD7DIL0_MYCRO|nr:hypothetical protein B0H17DRAFT_1179275 [Mycena rosella]
MPGPGADPIDGLSWCSGKTFTDIVRAKSTSFLRASVRNVILLEMKSLHIEIVLSICTDLENLYVMADHYLATVALNIVPLRHLYCGLVSFGLLNDTSSSHINTWNFSKTMWKTVSTPLEVTTAPHRVTSLPDLTHLSLNSIDSLAIVPYLLAACTFLRVLIIQGNPLDRLPESLAEDPRCVIMFVGDGPEGWQRGVITGDDYWARADASSQSATPGESSVRRRCASTGLMSH